MKSAAERVLEEIGMLSLQGSFAIARKPIWIVKRFLEPSFTAPLSFHT
ncbi:MAG TPA: hypothetical protein IGS53_12430 [Leptolyngbyaceae cyanobacterium M33_DOE_097]|nr:hypothetical protein [Leptolyngbyaceae cyanobacterium M33_DOE_097]